MTPEEKDEYAAAAKFMRNAAQHIDLASDDQKRTLLELLLQHPPEISATEMAERVWAALTEKELMGLMAKLQKKHDKEFWEFASRWR